MVFRKSGLTKFSRSLVFVVVIDVLETLIFHEAVSISHFSAIIMLRKF